MNWLRTTLLATVISVLACAAPAPPPATAPPPPVAPAPQAAPPATAPAATATAPAPAATASPTATPAAAPTQPTSAQTGKAPTVPALEGIAWPHLPAELAEVSKAFSEKYYDGARELLEAHLKKVKKSGEPDGKVLTYALLGFSHQMRDDLTAADRAYRKTLAAYGAFSKTVKKLRKDPKEGAKRAERGLFAIGAALFYFGEKRRYKTDEIPFPYYSGGDDPQQMTTFFQAEVEPWQKKIGSVIQKATKEYRRAIDLKPEPSPYWQVAAHSRIGAMAAIIAYNIRAVPVPDSWSKDGDSSYKSADGKPVAWKLIRATHQARVDRLVKNAMAQAKVSYGHCKRLATEHKLDNLFSKSCTSWLDANAL